MAAALVLGTSGEIRVGSSPTLGTKLEDDVHGVHPKLETLWSGDEPLGVRDLLLPPNSYD